MKDYFTMAEELYGLTLPDQSTRAIQLARVMLPLRHDAVSSAIEYIDLAHAADRMQGVLSEDGKRADFKTRQLRPYLERLRNIAMAFAFAMCVTATATAQDACDLSAPVTLPEGGLKGFHLRVAQDYLGWSDVTTAHFLRITVSQYESLRFCNAPPKGLYYALIKQARIKACNDKQRAIKEMKADKEGAEND